MFHQLGFYTIMLFDNRSFFSKFLNKIELRGHIVLSWNYYNSIYFDDGEDPEVQKTFIKSILTE